MIERMVAERFRFFGQDLVLMSDTPRVVAALAAVYERHLAGPTLAPAPRPRIQIRVLGDPESGGPAVEVEGRRIRVPAGAQLEHFAHLVMINAAAAVAVGRLVLHAGAVARDGRSLLIVGPSGWGKTTLTLELVRRGWGFLSDDFAPIDATGIVTAFPRRVNLTDASVAMLGVTLPPTSIPLASVGGQRKWMTDVEELLACRVSPPARLDSIFLMAARHVAAAGTERWRVRLSDLSDGLARDIERLSGVRSIERVGAHSGPVLDLYLAPGARIAAALEGACRDHETAVLAADNAPWSEPTFDSGPDATALTIEAALPVLVAHAVTVNARRFLRGAIHADGLRETAFLRGALAANNARVFRLEPGVLTRTADLVELLSGG